MRLLQALDNVNDRESFVVFVQVLIKDRESGTGWENDTIENYFAAALACVEDNRARDDILQTASWRSFAEFLYVGKIYE